MDADKIRANHSQGKTQQGGATTHPGEVCFPLSVSCSNRLGARGGSHNSMYANSKDVTKQGKCPLGSFTVMKENVLFRHDAMEVVRQYFSSRLELYQSQAFKGLNKKQLYPEMFAHFTFCFRPMFHSA